MPLLSMSQIPDLACLGGLGCGQGQGPFSGGPLSCLSLLVQTHLIESRKLEKLGLQILLPVVALSF